MALDRCVNYLTPFIFAAALFLSFAGEAWSGQTVATEGNGVDAGYEAMKKRLVDRFGSAEAHEWGETVTGVKTRIKTNEKIIALTMDACGSSRGMGVDYKMLEFLERERVPATLFINARWIVPNQETFNRLAANPLFEIANHGLRHKPASVKGKSVYGIDGTRNVAELVDEIELNARKIEGLTGRRPVFYRSGTAYYDEIAVQISEALGHKVAGFSVLGDRGATYSREEVIKALLSSTPGSIIIVHMNHPEAGTGAGLIDALPELKRRGFMFVRLSDLPLR
jgi:peptidoglycan/xylan/chitin deacetylase (PgdA/CDA1 family)